MLNLGKANYGVLKKKGKLLTEAFYDYMDEHVHLPASLNMAVFPNDFFDASFYLVLPYFFKAVFEERNGRFSKEICISGYFYFKYLLCMDDLNDQDDIDQEGNRTDNQSLLIMRSHIYHEEALKLLGKYFGNKPDFWNYWAKRNKEFLGSILLDKHFNPKMAFEQYCQLAIGKCAFAKVAVDAFYVRHQDKNELYEALISSMDLFAIARCIQDDLEDFKKDIRFEKNNYAIIKLYQWMEQEELNWKEQSYENLEKYLFVSGEAEKLLAVCTDYYQQAYEKIAPWRELLPEYVNILETLRNHINIFKVNIHAYRVSKLTSSIISAKKQRKRPSLEQAIQLSHGFIEGLQNEDGSWNEISNMQGLSNVWSTGYIASFLDGDDQCLIKATDFLESHKQGDLWGYNTDWTPDYDSTTCVLMALTKSEKSVEGYLPDWFEGQHAGGGFSTYHQEDETLMGRLGLKKRQVSGWTSEHICVSALAFYFLSHLPNKAAHEERYEQLVQFLLESQTKRGIWKPYWWTSFIYPTAFIVQGFLQDKGRFAAQIQQSVQSLVSHQNEDGSFSCEVLGEKSVFYTALVLDTLAADFEIAAHYKRELKLMKDFIIKNQFEDGGFQSTHFLVIPNPNQKTWSPRTAKFKRNIAGGGNTITGEMSNLFTTAVSHRALARYKQLDPIS